MSMFTPGAGGARPGGEETLRQYSAEDARVGQARAEHRGEVKLAHEAQRAHRTKPSLWQRLFRRR